MSGAKNDPFDDWARENVEANDPTLKIYPRSPPMAQLKPEARTDGLRIRSLSSEMPVGDGVALKNISHPHFGIGDLVQLRSGGPRMTVFDHIYAEGAGHLYRTSWFVGENLRRECFGQQELVLKLRAPIVKRDTPRAKSKNRRRRSR